MKMNIHIEPHFEIPSASFSVVSLITIGIWIPCYELFMRPSLAKITKQEKGFTSLQKIIIGNIFSVLTMVSAGRRSGVSQGVPMSATWLTPKILLLEFCEVFTIVGHVEFCNSESPEKMKSIGYSLQYLLVAFSNYVGTLVVNIVQKMTQRLGKTDWMNDDINRGRLDYYYFVIAGLSALNLVYLMFYVKRCCHKVSMKAKVLGTPGNLEVYCKN